MITSIPLVVRIRPVVVEPRPVVIPVAVEHIRIAVRVAVYGVPPLPPHRVII